MKNITSSKSVLFNRTSLKGVNALFNLVFLCVGKILLGVLHHIYSFTIFLRKHYIRILRFNSPKTMDLPDAAIIKHEISNCTKVPSHLVIILGPESPSYIDLVKMITWCFPAGITHISFYDHKNALDPQTLFETMSAYGKNYIPKIKWGKSFSDEIKTISKKLINGYSWSPLIHVHIFTSEDSLGNMVETVKYLHRQGVKSINQSVLEGVMREHFRAPDPDLAIICGPALSYYGFPPWHLRITLMQRITSHYNLNVSTFVQFLHKYSKSEQRYGK